MISVSKKIFAKYTMISILSTSLFGMVLLSMSHAEAKVFLGTSGNDSIVGTTKDDVMIGKGATTHSMVETTRQAMML